MNKKIKEVETVNEAVVKTTKKGIASLLSNTSTKGEKLSGIVRMMGEAELLRSTMKRQTMLNKVSKVGSILAEKSDEEILADAKLLGVGLFISKNMGVLKTYATEKDVEISTEMTEAYKVLLSYGDKVKFQDISEDLDF